MAVIALKVDVDTLRGTREGVPRLLDILARRNLHATFLFSLGPDHTGWALRRAFRPGFASKVSRTSVLAHYGLKTLMYGVLLPGPDIGRRAADEMRAASAAGHECGIHTWDHVLWHDNVRKRDAAWTTRQMTLAFDRYVDVFGRAPSTHGAAGWQMNLHALTQIDAWNMPYASDGRGEGPYRVVADGLSFRHVQLPTTLPTFDELIGIDRVTEDNIGETIAALTVSTGKDQVFTLHAELEGGLLSSRFAELLDRWRDQGHELVTLRTFHERLDTASIPQAPFSWTTVPGRSGELMGETR